MKKINIALLSLALLAGASSCDDKLDVVNTNQPTTAGFGDEPLHLEETVIAAYHHIRLDGSFSRLGYLMEALMGDEITSYSDNDWWRGWDWYTILPTSEDASLSFRCWYYAVNSANFVLSKVDALPDGDQKNYLKGQALFIRGLSYYELSCNYQDVPLITDYNQTATLDGMYVSCSPQSDVLDQAENDFEEAMKLLPKKDLGGEWAKGRATCGAAAGYLARVYMFRQKYDKALPILTDVIDQKYGTYDLTADYGDNFRSGSYENNKESMFEIQYLDYGSQGKTDEWLPANNDKDPSQGHALETVFSPAGMGGWNDLGATPWLYNLFKAEKTTDGYLDPRLYWTIGSYEEEYNSRPGFSNEIYMHKLQSDPFTNNVRGGYVIVKHTSARENLYDNVTAGMKGGVNIRLLRFSDILLRAAECENEINGPTSRAFAWINRVRNRAGLANLDESKLNTKDLLFEQIANVERPKEFGCEHGRHQDIIRWGFLYDQGRLTQLRKHCVYFWQTNKVKGEWVPVQVKAVDNLSEIQPFTPLTNEEKEKATEMHGYDDAVPHFIPGHEYTPLSIVDMNSNSNLKGNSANNTTSNASFYDGKTIHPVVELP